MLGLRVWQTAQRSDGTVHNFYYRLGSWVLITASRFDQKQPSWHADVLAALADLSEHGKETLAEVSASTVSSWPAAHVLDLRAHATEKHQLAHLKQSLWQQVSQSLAI